ncbi:MAG TPA: thioesterase family protein [Bacillota bacterium]|nr:thioesterase family protein [Bacillota bacterium]
MMFETTIDVRYYETDMQKIVHHSNYLRWFEIVRTKLLESLGVTMTDIENEGVFYVMKEARLDYIKPVKYGEKVTLCAKLTTYNGIRLVHEYQVKVNDEIRCTGQTTLATIKQSTMLPANLKKISPKIHQIILDSVEIDQ